MPAEAKATKPAATTKLRARAMESKFANPRWIFLVLENNNNEIMKIQIL